MGLDSKRISAGHSGFAKVNSALGDMWKKLKAIFSRRAYFVLATQKGAVGIARRISGRPVLLRVNVCTVSHMAHLVLVTALNKPVE